MVVDEVDGIDGVEGSWELRRQVASLRDRSDTVVSSAVAVAGAASRPDPLRCRGTHSCCRH